MSNQRVWSFRDIKLPLIDILCSVDYITELVDTTDITIIPTINPDGFDRGTEGACSGADYRTGRYNEGGHTGGEYSAESKELGGTTKVVYELISGPGFD